MARRNLKYQFLQAINNSFRENMDKHSDKANGIRNTDKIYSYSARSNLIDLSANFANFMKESYPEIHKANEVGTEHIQAFLNSKTENCSQATLNQYSALFRKLEKCVNVKYHCNVVYHCDVVPASCKNGGGKIRNVMLSQSDFKTLIKNTSNQNLKKALTLSYHFGLRCAECAKLKFEDIKSNGISIIDSKGKRSRFIPAETEKQKQILEQFKEKEQGRICPVQHQSLEQAFRRELKKNGIVIQNGAFHTCRKAYATQKYKEYRENGLSVKEAKRKFGDDEVSLITSLKPNMYYDDYRNNSVLVFDEFYSQIPIHQMLNLLDNKITTFPCRYANKYNLSTTVILTSNNKFELQYVDEQADNYETYTAFCRRFTGGIWEMYQCATNDEEALGPVYQHSGKRFIAMKQGSANAKPPVEIDSSVEWISYTQLQNVKGFDILRGKFAIPVPF